MYLLTTEQTFDAAHFLKGHLGACSNIHGHRLRPVTIEVLKEEGFQLTEVSFRPTSECFARHFYEEFRARQLPVYDVTVYETPGNCSTYREE